MKTLLRFLSTFKVQIQITAQYYEIRMISKHSFEKLAATDHNVIECHKLPGGTFSIVSSTITDGRADSGQRVWHQAAGRCAVKCERGMNMYSNRSSVATYHRLFNSNIVTQRSA